MGLRPRKPRAVEPPPKPTPEPKAKVKAQTKAKSSQAKASQAKASQAKAKVSQTKAKVSQTKAKASPTKAKASQAKAEKEQADFPKPDPIDANTPEPAHAASKQTSTPRRRSPRLNPGPTQENVPCSPVPLPVQGGKKVSFSAAPSSIQTTDKRSHTHVSDTQSANEPKAKKRKTTSTPSHADKGGEAVPNAVPQPRSRGQGSQPLGFMEMLMKEMASIRRAKIGNAQKPATKPPSDSDVAVEGTTSELTPHLYRSPTVESVSDEESPKSWLKKLLKSAKFALPPGLTGEDGEPMVIPVEKIPETDLQGIQKEKSSDASPAVSFAGVWDSCTLGSQTTTCGNPNLAVSSSDEVDSNIVYNTVLACHQLRAQLLDAPWRDTAFTKAELLDAIKAGYIGEEFPPGEASWRDHEMREVDGDKKEYYFPKPSTEVELLESLVQRGREPFTNPDLTLSERMILFRIRKILKSLPATEWVTTKDLCKMVNDIKETESFGTTAHFTLEQVADVARMLWEANTLEEHPRRDRWGQYRHARPWKTSSWDTDHLCVQYFELWYRSRSHKKPDRRTGLIRRDKRKKQRPNFSHFGPRTFDIWPSQIIEDSEKFKGWFALTRNMFFCLGWRFGHMIRRLEVTVAERLYPEGMQSSAEAQWELSISLPAHVAEYEKLADDALDSHREFFPAQLSRADIHTAKYRALLFDDYDELCKIWPEEAQRNWSTEDAVNANRELEEIHKACSAYAGVHGAPLSNDDLLAALDKPPVNARVVNRQPTQGDGRGECSSQGQERDDDWLGAPTDKEISGVVV